MRAVERSSLRRRLCATTLAWVISTATWASPEEQVAAGKLVFVQCAVCHAAEPGAKKIGPSLHGVLNRPSGSVAEYRYSAGMLAFGGRWDAATLDLFLTEPRALIPGTYMAAPGIRNAQDRQALLAYLATLQ